MKKIMVAVAQMVERRIVIPVVVGSIPIVHPIYSNKYLAISEIADLDKAEARVFCNVTQ